MPQAQAQFPNLPGGFVVDTANKDLIKLVNSEKGTFFFENNTTLNVIVGNVEFDHKGDLLFADSARLNVNKNVVHAYGNVRILQTDGTVAFADRMYYDGNTKIVELIGDVELNNGADYLWSNKIIYNLTTQIGKYNNNGTLQTANTVIESKTATYNGKNKNARFTGDVNILDPEYEVVSADLNYNTNSRLVTFYGPSIINNDSSTLFTTKGTYDSEKEIAIFQNRSSIQSDGQYMEADSMFYNRKTGLGVGVGQVIVIDSVRESTMWSEMATVNEKTKQVLAVGNPYMRMVKDLDTTYIKADTFFTEPTRNMIRPIIPITAQDSLLYALDILNRDAGTGAFLDSNLVKELDELYLQIKRDSLDVDSVYNERFSISDEDTFDLIEPLPTVLDFSDSLLSSDTASATMDSIPKNYRNNKANNLNENPFQADKLQPKITAESEIPKATNNILENSSNPAADKDPRYFVAYRNVVVYNDSFQAKADSMRYSQEDSIMQFHQNPILWSRHGQITGDVILAMVDTNNIKWVHIPRNGIIINQSTPANEIMFDQIQGNVIWAYFTNNEMDSIIAIGNAETIYYIKDEQDAYVGVSEANSANLKILFHTDSTGNRAIESIRYYIEASQKMTPMEKSNPESLKLSRHSWRIQEKLKSKADFFKLVTANENTETLKEEVTDALKNPTKDNNKKEKAKSKKKGIKKK